MILVTGAAGNIGSNLCLHLLNRKEKVIGVDNFITGSNKNLSSILTNPNFTFIEANIIDEKIQSTLEKYPIKEIFHLACPTGVNNLERLSEEMLLASSIGTKNILEIAKRKKTSLLYFSSSEVYGNPWVFPQPESYWGNVDPIGIRSPYEEGKRFSEALITSFVKKYHVNAKIVRIFNTFGPGDLENDFRAVPSFITKALKNEDLNIYGDGKHTRTFLYVDDLIDGVMLIMKKAAEGSVYNIGSDIEISILELANLIIKISSSKSRINFLKHLSYDVCHRCPDLTKIKKLGWKQSISLEEGLKRVLLKGVKEA
ncbi:MAG: GDP-mannose 4,6-dehydratase [Chlamydiae bacterium]|nr:GDP-mannose 4,6-dehydratase [Chlamydiota bacterium]